MQPIERDGFYTYMWDYTKGAWAVMRERRRIGHVGQDGDRWWSQGLKALRKNVGFRARNLAARNLWSRQKQESE